MASGVSPVFAARRSPRWPASALTTTSAWSAGTSAASPCRQLGALHLPDPTAADFYPEWDRVATELVAHLRSQAGRNPYDRWLSGLIGELSTRSGEFRVRWAAHDVRLHRTGAKHFRHPVVGELDLAFDAMEVPADAGLTLTAYTAEPGSAAAEKLTLLASWAAPLPEPGSTSAPDRPGR